MPWNSRVAGGSFSVKRARGLSLWPSAPEQPWASAPATGCSFSGGLFRLAAPNPGTGAAYPSPRGWGCNGPFLCSLTPTPSFPGIGGASLFRPCVQFHTFLGFAASAAGFSRRPLFPGPGGWAGVHAPGSYPHFSGTPLARRQTGQASTPPGPSLCPGSGAFPRPANVRRKFTGGPQVFHPRPV